MKKITKILAVILALSMVLSLAACGESSSSSSTGTDTAAKSEAAATDTKSEAAAPAATEAAKSDEKTGVAEVETGTTATDAASFVRKTEEGTLTVGTTMSVDGFDPTSSTNYIGEQLVYETLFYIDPDTAEVTPMLADTWEYQDDTHLYIKLKDEATFSSGNPVTCEDVIWSWYRTIENDGSESQNLVFVDWDNIEIMNDKEMVIAYTEPFAPALNFMCMFAWASVLDKKAMENATADDYWSNPVGSGPYTVVENVSGSGTTYALRDDYWWTEKMPEAKTIYVKNYTSSSTLYTDYEAGNLDVAFDFTTADSALVLDGLVEDTNYRKLNNCDVISVAYPEYTESLQDIRVREALSAALDMEFIVDFVWGDLGEVATSLFPKFLPEAIDTESVPYDPEHAKELLAEAGYDASNPLELNIVIVNTEDILIDLATIIQEQWNQVGVILNVDGCDLSTAISHYMNSETDIIFDKGGGLSSYDPYELLQMSGKDSSNATIRITDETFNEYCYIGKTSLDEAEHMQAYADAQNYLADNKLRQPIAEQYSLVVYRPYIADVHTLGGTDNHNVRWVDLADI